MIEVGTITGVSGNTVTVVNSGPVTGLPTSPATYVFYTNSVTQDYGWTGANNDIVQMQNAILAFTNQELDQDVQRERPGTVFWRSGLAQVL